MRIQVGMPCTFQEAGRGYDDVPLAAQVIAVGISGVSLSVFTPIGDRRVVHNLPLEPGVGNGGGQWMPLGGSPL